MDKSVVVLSPRARASLTLMPFILPIVGRVGAADGNACLLLKTSRIVDRPSTHSGKISVWVIKLLDCFGEFDELIFCWVVSRGWGLRNTLQEAILAPIML